MPHGSLDRRVRWTRRGGNIAYSLDKSLVKCPAYLIGAGSNFKCASIPVRRLKYAATRDFPRTLAKN